MYLKTDDLRIRELRELASPETLLASHPLTAAAARTVADARSAVQRILHGTDDRLIVVIGPCSIHDVTAAQEYAARLARERLRHARTLEIVMRVYFEKPRTTVGWKGLINDPDLDGSFRIDRGLTLARELLLHVNELGLPAGCEFLDTTTPQYLADLVAWGAIGARTTESQVHRELASGLSCPIGFKNGTQGDVRIAVDAVRAASEPHHFLAVSKHGRCAIASTTGNRDCHVILRGGAAPNYDASSVAAAARLLAASGVRTRLMIDASHGNSGKRPERQASVIESIAAQLEAAETPIGGVMIESHLLGGRQDLTPGQPLRYGQSITDACHDWESSCELLERLAHAVAERRARVTRRSGLCVTG